MFEQQFLFAMFFSERDSEDDLPLNVHHLVDHVNLAVGVQSWPLEEPLVDHFKDGVAHRLELATVEGM